MDFEHNNESGSVPSESDYGSITPPPPRRLKKRKGWRVFWNIILVMSIITNVVLFFMVIGLGLVFAAGQDDFFTENIVRSGRKDTKIAIVNLQGLIDNEKAGDVCRQIQSAASDAKVKGVILRINSPGGLVSSSDQIHNEIIKFRNQTKKPVVAFMQGIAASGGYYASVACDRIVAEPTTITGSVGVIMNYFVFQGLLEEKLGIEPVVIKSGRKKDWPSPFTSPSDEQRQYIQDKLIVPAYERFVKLVADGREGLSIADVKRLADGSIYNAAEALEEKMIDRIGYLDDAISEVMSLAVIEDAQVIEYKRPFSLRSFLGASSNKGFRLDRKTLHEFSTPEILYLWNGF